jgi:hypothetical protein
MEKKRRKRRISMNKWAGQSDRVFMPGEILHVLGSCSSVIVQEWKSNSCQDNSMFCKHNTICIFQIKVAYASQLYHISFVLIA